MQEHRIYGPPGTGKTSTLTRMVTEAADYYGPSGVMICSYTTAAASEIASRALTVPEDNIGTLHKFCYSAIGRPEVLEAKGKKIKEWNEFAPAFALSAPGCRDINSGLEYGDSATPGDNLFSLTTVLRNRMVPRELWPASARAFIEAWTSWKNVTGGIDYTDMLEIALRDCSQAPGVPAVIYVDEAQDCTALQFAVLKKWAANIEKLVMVGDDDQCIYQFAGATPEAFAVGEVTEHDAVLEESFRVPFAVWEHALTWIRKVRDRVEKDYLPRRGDPGFVSRCPYSYRQPEKIAELAVKGLTKHESVMIIGSCSYMVEPVMRALREMGITFHNPYRLIRADWNPLRLAKGTTYAQRVAAFLKPKISGELWTPDDIRVWADHLKADGVFIKNKKGKIHEGTDTARMLLDLFTPEAFEHITACDLDWWEANLVNEDARKKSQYPLKIARNLGPEFLDTDAIPPRIVIGTIHSVKGGEADVVILLPDLSQQGMEEWSGKGRAAIRRLMYVGATRARNGLILCKPASPFTCDI